MASTVQKGPAERQQKNQKEFRRSSAVRSWTIADNRVALFVPADFAHGFITLVDTTDVHFLMGAS